MLFDCKSAVVCFYRTSASGTELVMFNTRRVWHLIHVHQVFIHRYDRNSWKRLPFQRRLTLTCLVALYSCIGVERKVLIQVQKV